MKARHVGQVALAVAGGYLTVLVATRRYHQHWGAGDAEITRSLPGDDLIPVVKLDSTHAIKIRAPAERIWPWLAQMGYGGRAGFYSYDIPERRFGARDSCRLNPEMAAPVAGDCLPFAPGTPMTVAVVDPSRALVLWQVSAAGKAIDPAALGRGLHGVELGVRARTHRREHDAAADPDARQLPAGRQVGGLRESAARAGSFHHGPPSAPGCPPAS